MLFNSYVFILFFLPICIIGYFSFNHFKQYMLAQIFLLGMSLWFYGYFNPQYLLIIIASIVFNYGFSTLFSRIKKANIKKFFLILAIFFNVGILFYFKYYDFFIQNMNAVFKTQFTLQNILLPLGISFFTFQQISFVVDAYRGEVIKYNFVQYASFVTYFPQLIAGPIVTWDELIPQFKDETKKKFNWDNFAKGIYIFILGLSKKVLLADVFGNAVNWGFANIDFLDTTNAIITMLAYTIQIYFDFSGYCDMAIGIGKMMNIDLPLNFNSPYKAMNIAEFWERWHMTLTRFFTKYIYIPLGGSRRGALRTYLNVMLIYIISGFWHGANWTFILWGLLHGLFSVIYKWGKKWFDRMHPVFSWSITFGFLNITWVLFRADSIKQAGELLKRIFAMNFGNIHWNITDAFNLVELKFLLTKVLRLNILETHPQFLLLLFFVVAFVLILGVKNAYEKMLDFKPTLARMLFSAVLLVWCIVSFSGVSTFLYFNF